MLLGMLVLVVGVGWIRYRMVCAQENRDRLAATEEVVAEIWKLVGFVESEYKEKRPQTWLERQFDDPGDDDDPEWRRLAYPRSRTSEVPEEAEEISSANVI